VKEVRYKKNKAWMSNKQQWMIDMILSGGGGSFLIYAKKHLVTKSNVKVPKKA